MQASVAGENKILQRMSVQMLSMFFEHGRGGLACALQRSGGFDAIRGQFAVLQKEAMRIVGDDMLMWESLDVGMACLVDNTPEFRKQVAAAVDFLENARTDPRAMDRLLVSASE